MAPTTDPTIAPISAAVLRVLLPFLLLEFKGLADEEDWVDAEVGVDEMPLVI